jgi:hypothetical protein
LAKKKYVLPPKSPVGDFTLDGVSSEKSGENIPLFVCSLLRKGRQYKEIDAKSAWDVLLVAGS